jgi:hypothetical protein
MKRTHTEKQKCKKSCRERLDTIAARSSLELLFASEVFSSSFIYVVQISAFVALMLSIIVGSSDDFVDLHLAFISWNSESKLSSGVSTQAGQILEFSRLQNVAHHNKRGRETKRLLKQSNLPGF